MRKGDSGDVEESLGWACLVYRAVSGCTEFAPRLCVGHGDMMFGIEGSLESERWGYSCGSLFPVPVPMSCIPACVSVPLLCVGDLVYGTVQSTLLSAGGNRSSSGLSTNVRN